MKRGGIAILLLLTLIGLSGLFGVGSGIVGLMVLGVVAGALVINLQPNTGAPTMKERETEADRLRAARERERAFYKLASTLSSTLDHQKVLETALNIGKLAAHESSANAKIVSASLLFKDGEENLHVVNSQGLTRADQQLAVAGKQGVLGLALKQGQSEPVFATMPQRDPELQYFAAFQECKSILALPLRAGYTQYGVLVFGSDQPDAFSPEYVELLKAIGTLTTIALQNAVLYQNILQEKDKIVVAEEDARKKLARDLHDGPTQSVAAIAMRANFVRRLVDKEHAQAFDELGKIEELARATTKEIRHMLFTLRPLVLETQGLVPALEQFSEKMKDTYKLNVIIEAKPGVEQALDAQAQGVVFYIVEEAVNNARKHAQSEHIWVRLQRQNQYFMIEVEDDGVGFDVEGMKADYLKRKSSSLGMVNMQDRTEMIQGTLDMTSQVGKGTKIRIVAPVREGTLTQTPPQSPQLAAAETDKPTQPKRPFELPPQEKPNIPFASKRSPNN